MSKDKITNYLNSLTPEQSELIFGSPNADSLRYGFKSKRTVHPGVGSRPIMPVFYDHKSKTTLTVVFKPSRRLTSMIS